MTCPRLVLLPFCTISALVAACEPAEPPAKTPSSAASTSAPDRSKSVVVNEASAGKTFAIAAGQRLSLGLSGDVDHTWAVLSKPTVLGEPVKGLAPGAAAGGKALHMFMWHLAEPLGPGDHPLELGYRLASQKDGAPEKTFRIVLRSAP